MKCLQPNTESAYRLAVKVVKNNVKIILQEEFLQPKTKSEP